MADYVYVVLIMLQSIVAILNELRWTFVAVVYTDDNYGVMGSQMLKEAAAVAKICINESIVISGDTGMDTVVSRLVNMRHRAEDESLAVVYIGGKDKAENLIFHVRSRSVRDKCVCVCVCVCQCGVRGVRGWGVWVRCSVHYASYGVNA